MLTLPSVTLSAGTIVQVTTGQSISAIVITNESPLSLYITVGGLGYVQQVAAYTIDIIRIPSVASYSGSISVNPMSILNSSSSSPASEMIVTVYGLGEVVAGAYPVALQRLTNIGNTVNSSVTSTNAISNTTNAPLSTWLTVTPTDAASPTFSADTSGNLTVKSDNAGVLSTLLQLIAGASPSVMLAAAAILTEALGNMKVDGTFESVGAATLDSTLSVTGITTVGDKITGGASNDVKLDAATGKTVFLKVNGVNIVGVNNTGAVLQGAFNFDIGSSGVFRFRNGNTTQAWGNFTGTGSGTYNHGFGSAPFAVIPIVDVVGSATQGYDTITSTQVHITLGASLGFRATMWS